MIKKLGISKPMNNLPVRRVNPVDPI